MPEDVLPHNSEGFLNALYVELESVKRNKPGGQPSDPDRVRVVEAEIARVRKELRKGGRKETAVAQPPLETTSDE